jgi:chemotaxis protein methyltransferase CheR
MDYERFKDEILKLTGINLSYYKEKQMKRRIDSLIRKNNYENYGDYVVALKLNRVLFDEFVNYLTINVSEFYRNPAQWEVLEKDVFPRLLAKTKSLRIWSAACSTGDEPYTLVMVLSKFLPLNNIRIIATDIDKAALDKARTGVYSYKSMEKLPHAMLERFCIKDGGNYRIKDEIKACVEFRQHNLLKDDYPQGCDLIVCRNVLIYFTEEAKNLIYIKFNKSLKTDCILFVGSTEQIIMSNKYNLVPIKTFFYTKEKDL